MMKSKIGTLFMIAGVALMLGVLLFFSTNVKEQNNAAAASGAVIPKVVDAIQHRRRESQTPAGAVDEELQNKVMTVVEIDGNDYIGFLGIPALELELPVMSDWSYPQLQVAPCRYTGGMYTDDLVLMAHNYNSHFGRISQLEIMDELTFTDMDGNVTVYQVVGKDVLDPTAVEEMTSGTFDLTLFTCTYGGRSRITVYCDRMI